MAFSNSKLVNYTKLSPNHSGTRNHVIDKIAIHHMSGNLTVETCGSVFAPASRQASSNYGIGSDGRVGMYVEEKNRSWCTASAECDNRAVTIEVANDQIGGNWHVSDKALAKLIDLCVDICQRNGIKKLNYTGDKSGNMIMHRWYAPTDCPGAYLASKFPYIQEQVNKRLNGATSSSASSTSKPTTSTTTTTNTNVNVTYMVATQKHGWLAEVKNLEDYAGWENSPITKVAIKVSKGSVKYRVHVKGGGWLPYVTGYNKNDNNNGFAGNGKAIDAIEVYYTTPSDIRPYKRAKYRVAPTTGSYYDWQYDNEKTGGQDGFAGVIGQAIGKIQVSII